MVPKRKNSLGGGGAIPASAIVLGGGEGRRMGGNKLFLAVDGLLLLHCVLDRICPWFREVLLAVGPKDASSLSLLLEGRSWASPVRVVVDRAPGKGPLAGLVAGLREMDSPWAFLMGCDMPWIQEPLVRRMWALRDREEGVLCWEREGYLEPLHAFYSRSCLPFAEEALARKDHKLKSFYPQVPVQVVPEEAFADLPGHRRSFEGINTPLQLERFRESR